jgi:ADP-heptose:LPS heptosyltransferase
LSDARAEGREPGRAIRGHRRERIAVLRALPGVGDLLCAVPALRALRQAEPDAHVTLIGLEAAGWFVSRFGQYVDELLVLPAFPGLPEVPPDPYRALAFCAEAQAREFDLALQLHGDGTVTNTLLALLGAREMAGHLARGSCPPGPGTFPTYQGVGSEIERLLGLLAALGVPAAGTHLEFPRLPEDEREHEGLLRAGLLPAGPYACVHPGATDPRRRWGVRGFARAVDELSATGLPVVLTGSPAEAGLCRAVAEQAAAPVIDLAGRTSLGGLAVVLADARLLVANDTGVSHLAAAVGTPSVIVFTGSDPERWAPLDRIHHRAVGRPAAPGRAERCRPDACVHPSLAGPLNRDLVGSGLAAVRAQLASAVSP